MAKAKKIGAKRAEKPLPSLDAFTDVVLAAVRGAFPRSFEASTALFIVEGPGLDATVRVAERSGKVVWAMMLGGEDFPQRLAGGGILYRRAKPERVLVEHRAALRPAYRGRGIYPLVLRALRAHFGVPVVSDAELSAGNRRVWAKVGVRAGGRWRINPARLNLRAVGR